MSGLSKISNRACPLQHVFCVRFAANTMYYTIEMLAFNLNKLMQILVLSSSWVQQTVRSVRHGLFRFVARVIPTIRQWVLRIHKTTEEIRQLLRIQEKIGALVPVA